MHFVKSAISLMAGCVLSMSLTYAHAASVTASTIYEPMVANTSSLYPVNLARTDPQAAVISWLTDMPTPDPTFVWGDHVRQYANVNANGVSNSAMVIFDGSFAQNLISWQDTFSNQSGNSLNYKLNVELAPMSFRMASFSPMNARTGFVADVLVNGVSVWHSAQTFTRQGQSNSSSSEGFDMGDAIEFGDLATQVSYEHSGYRGLVDLGTFAAGQTATVTYRFSQFTYLDKRRDCTIFCGEVFAAADKTGVNQQRIISAPVPEPESYAMLLGGLGLIGAIRRRKAAAK